MDLLCIGDVMVDVHADPGAPGDAEHGGDVRIQPGGTSANAAVWAAWDGAKARVHGAVGVDLTGQLVQEALRERGVKMHLVPHAGASTGVMLHLREGEDRRVVAERGANALLRPEDLPGMLVCGAVLVSGYLLLHEDTRETARVALERAVAPFIAVEAASAPLLEALGSGAFFEATQRATVVLANEDEARVLSGRAGEAAARALGERYPVAAVKLGPEGAVIVADGRLHRAAAEPVLEVDPTGAGDAFDGVLLGALARGATVEDALGRACRAGALVAGSRGTWPEMPGVPG